MVRIVRIESTGDVNGDKLLNSLDRPSSDKLEHRSDIIDFARLIDAISDDIALSSAANIKIDQNPHPSY